MRRRGVERHVRVGLLLATQRDRRERRREDRARDARGDRGGGNGEPQEPVRARKVSAGAARRGRGDDVAGVTRLDARGVQQNVHAVAELDELTREHACELGARALSEAARERAAKAVGAKRGVERLTDYL